MTPKIKEMIEREAERRAYNKFPNKGDLGSRVICESTFISGATFMHSYYAPRLKKAIEALSVAERFIRIDCKHGHITPEFVENKLAEINRILNGTNSKD